MAVSPPASPIRIIGVTAAKVTPWMIGSRKPTFQNPTVWTRVANPHVKRSALIRYTSSSSESPMAFARMSGTATAPAYIARTCWNPRTASFPAGNTSSTGCKRPSSTLSSDTFPLPRAIPAINCDPGVRLLEPPRQDPGRLTSLVERRGVLLRLHLHLHDVSPGIEGGLDDLARGLEHLRTPSGEHRGLGPGLVGEPRVAGSLLRRLDLLLRGPLGDRKSTRLNSSHA